MTNEVNESKANSIELTSEEHEDILKTLITVCNTVEEADGYVQNFSPEFKDEIDQIEEKEEAFKKKYDLVLKIFGYGECLSAKKTDTFETLYRVFLGTRIIQKWK